MTFVGKVLVVVQLVLSICFMAFAGAVYTYHREWKKEYEKARADLGTKQTELSQAQTKAQEREGLAQRTLTQHNLQFNAEGDLVTQTMEAIDGIVQERNNLIAERDALKTDLETEKQLKDSAEAMLGATTLETKLAVESKKASDRHASLLRELNLTAQADLQNKEGVLRDLEDSKFSLTRDVEELTRRYEDKIGDNARLRQLLLLNGLDPDAQPETDNAPPPPVEGLVLATRIAGSTEYVEISIGSDDGLEEGDSLFVYDGPAGKYLGRIRLVYITPDRSVGSVVEKAPNGRIVEGNNVSTEL